MTDEPDISGTLLPRVREPRVVALLLAATSVLAAGVVSAAVHTTDPTSAATVLHDVRHAQVVSADGAVRPAVDGTVVPRGGKVETGSGGAARLVTQGRSTYVGALATVKVVDGVHQALEAGEVMVDAQRGPRLALTTLAGDVDVPSDALVRISEGQLLRVGVFSGGARFVPTGRSTVTAVPPYFQAVANYTGALPTTTPLQLRDDRWEALLAPQLVAADADLSDDARQLQGSDGARVLAVAPAQYRTSLTDPALGDRALALLLAEAGHASGTTADRFGTVSGGRDQHGSWGVLAAIVDAPVKDVSTLLDQRLTTPGTVAAPAPTGPAVLTGPSASPSPGTAPSVPVSSGGSQRPSPRPTRTRAPGPAPTPSPTGGPVTALLGTVLGLLNPSPTPAPNNTGLVNGVTGGLHLGTSSP